jgi:hypothetical protein
MEKMIVKISGLLFLLITGFTAGSYYTMHKITSEEYQDKSDIEIDTPIKEIKQLCDKGEIITLKKKQYFCLPMRNV